MIHLCLLYQVPSVPSYAQSTKSQTVQCDYLQIPELEEGSMVVAMPTNVNLVAGTEKLQTLAKSIG
jgi:hypothetical protein